MYLHRSSVCQSKQFRKYIQSVLVNIIFLFLVDIEHPQPHPRSLNFSYIGKKTATLYNYTIIFFSFTKLKCKGICSQIPMAMSLQVNKYNVSILMYFFFVSSVYLEILILEISPGLLLMQCSKLFIHADRQTDRHFREVRY